MKFKIFGGKTIVRMGMSSLLALVFQFFLSPAARGLQTASLAWNASSDPGAAGYVLYGGCSGTNYTTRVDVGTNIAVTVTGLTEGRTNYFAVTAYNSAKMESPASGQIAYIVPGVLVMSKGATPGAAPQVSFPVAVGHWYEVQASTNLQSWATIWQTTSATTNSWVAYQDPQGTALKKRFYRLVTH